MSKSTFVRDIPDFKDIQNQTGRCPGFSTRIHTDDAYVGLTLTPIGEPDPMKTAGIALSRDDALAFLKGFQEAVDNLKEEPEEPNKSSEAIP